ncbi:MAG: ABC transporter ATP-binding protein [Polymorphobacter sp.]|uniref:ABC transporter ATP-binding protein n=1 Tax=Polymorphobacter sp. TaxID=1909290 RepID=UPI003A86879E
MDKPHPDTQHFQADWRQTLAFCRRYWALVPQRLAVVVVLTLAMVAAEVLVPVAAGRLVDTLGEAARQGSSGSAAAAAGRAAFLALGAMTGLLALYQLLGLANSLIYNVVAARCMSAVLDDGFAKVQRFSSDWHANSFAGSTVRKLTRGKWAYEQISDILIRQFLPLSLVITGLALIMFSRFPMVGLFFMGMIAVYVAVSVVLAVRWVRPANVRAAAADSHIGGAIADAVSNNAAVKGFGAEAREEALFRTITSVWHDRALISWGRARYVNLAQQGLWLLLQAGMLALLIGLAQRGEATPGDVAFVITACFQLGGSLRQVGDHIRTLQRASAELADLIEFDVAPLGVADLPAAPPLRIGGPHGRGEIIFDNVRFAYPADRALAGQGRARPPLYDGFDLRIAPGERVALVGPSGSGKSTFVKLIQRLYDVDEGAIWIDGQDIAGVQQTSLRRSVSIVPQEPVLFHRSLADNIAYARPEASEAEIIDCARRARAHEFIACLPQGYRTLVGERGVKLSGGERQRVAIARAFLADAPIVVFDEATSSLDTVTERLIQAAMAELMAGRTTIIIAHRLSTVRDADRILVFDAGRIVEQGTHSELLARGGAYARLHAAEEEWAYIG